MPRKMRGGMHFARATTHAALTSTDPYLQVRLGRLCRMVLSAWRNECCKESQARSRVQCKQSILAEERGTCEMSESSN